MREIRRLDLIALNMYRSTGGITHDGWLNRLLLQLIIGLICAVAGAAGWSYLVAGL